MVKLVTGIYTEVVSTPILHKLLNDAVVLSLCSNVMEHIFMHLWIFGHGHVIHFCFNLKEGKGEG